MYLKLENITKKFKDEVVFENISLEIKQPGIYYIKGKSGSGKTTLLNVIAGFEKYEGIREVNPDMQIAFIFQAYELIDELTVEENLRLVQDVFDCQNDEVIKQLGVDQLLSHYPNELSGGERQRVGIARALLVHPQVILCDEPTVSLDLENRVIVLELLKQLSKECVVLISSHNEEEINIYTDYIYEIKEKKLVALKSRDSDGEAKIKPLLKLHIQALRKYFSRILPAQKKVLCLSFMILGLLGILGIQIERQIFHPPIQDHVLNAYTLYVTEYGSASGTPLVSFEPMIIKDKYKQVSIYPYVQNENYTNVSLKDNEVVVNEAFAKLLSSQYENVIGQKVNASYRLEGEDYEYTFVVKSVIEEDTQTPQIYYSYDHLMNVFKHTFYSSKFPTQYDCLLKNCSLYQQVYSKDDYQKNYHRYANRQDVSVYNSVLTPYENHQNELRIYHMISLIVVVGVLVVGIVFQLYQEKKFVTAMKYRLSVFSSLSIPLAYTKKYALQTVLYPYFFITILWFVEIVGYDIIFQAPFENLIGVLGFAIGNVMIHFVYLINQIQSFHTSQILETLQNNKI